MKNLLHLAVSVVLAVGIRHAAIAPAVTAQPTTPPEFLLTPGKAGSFQIGDPVDAIYQRVGRERVTLVDLFKEGHFSPAIQIHLAGSDSPAIVADIREWPCGDFAMYGISVRDRRFRTPEGLGVGATVADLRLAYRVRASHEEGQSVIVQALKMSFAVDGDSEDDRSRVTSVWLWPDPEAVRLRRCPDKR